MTEPPTIQGAAPKRRIEASDVRELADAVRQCADADEKIVDYGEFHRGLGHAPPADHVRIAPPGGIIEHYVDDMTVRVRGGARLGEVNAALAERGQWLPLDGADDAITMAEAIAHNVAGSLRLGFGTLRDLLLGLRYVDAAGDEIAVGGRTVKNVAGYDMTKFTVGAMNTFGLISEATLRTYALPQHVTRAELGGVNPRPLDERMTALLTSDASPTYLLLQCNEPGEASMAAGYFGTEKGCGVQTESLKRWLSEGDAVADGIDVRDATLTEDTERRAAAQPTRGEHARVELIVPPASTGRLIEVLQQSVSPASLTALPTHGIVWISGAWPVGQTKDADAAIRRAVESVGGLRIWHQRPDDTPDIPPIAPAPADWPVLGRIIAALDPKERFNPGRLF
jgi:glycolate oxidase FAD binding subunit